MNEMHKYTGGIIVYRDGIPDELKDDFEKVSTYRVKQGIRGKNRGWERLNDQPSGTALASYEREAHEESISDDLRNKAFDMAIKQIIDKARNDKPNIAAISDPRITSSLPEVRRDGNYYRQAALTIEVEADAYKRLCSEDLDVPHS